MSDNKDKINVSVVAGELRKAARLYEVFKYAAEAATLLATLDKERKQVEKEKAILTKECLDLNSRCDLIVEQANTHKATVEAAKAQKANIVQETKDEATKIIQEAKNEAEKIITSNKNKLVNSTKIIENLQQEIKQLQNRKRDAEKEAVKVEREVKILKDNFIKAVS